MKTIRQWISDNPWTAVSLAAFFGVTSALAGAREDWLPYVGGAFVIGLLVMVFSMRNWAALALAAALAFPSMPAKAEEPPIAEGGAGVAVVVVVVGGVCVYLLVRTCQKVFPKTPAPSTNSPPDVRGTGDDVAGSWSYYAQVSCYTGQFGEEEWPQVTMELTGIVTDGPEFRLTGARKMTRAEDSQDFYDFQSDLARHGISMGPVGTQLFGRNGRPAEEQETPIRFSESGSEHVVTINSDTAPSVPIVLQRSFDLKTWKDFGFVSVPMGQQFRLIDTTTGQSAFYRIQPR